MAASRTSQRNAREFFELKQRAVQFYKANQVPEKLQAILNSMVYENPPDVYGRLSEYFEGISKPVTVSKVHATQTFGSTGQPTLKVDVFCTVRGLEKHISSCLTPSYVTIPENSPLERREKDEAERAESLKAAIEFINTSFSQALIGQNPSNQKEIDCLLSEVLDKLMQAQEESDLEEKNKVEILEEVPFEPAPSETIKNPSVKSKKKSGSAKSASVIIEEPKESLFCGCMSVCSLSRAVSKAGATVKNVQPYQHFADLCKNQESQHQVSYPVPMVTALSSGKAAPGKQNLIKELYLIPKPGRNFQQAMQQLVTGYNQIGKTQFSKLGVSALYTNNMGAFCPQYDRPDQLLELLTEAFLPLGWTLGEDIYIGLNCAAHEYYDPDKGKYEIMTGTLKTAEDMIEVYTDYLTRYPGVIALIDPLKKHDADAWTKLCERFSHQCFIIGENVFPRPERFISEGFGHMKSSGASLKMQNMTRITDIIKCSQMIKENDAICVMSSDVGEVTDTLLADLAVGLEATFVKFGAPVRGERVALYNRLREISQMLESQDLLVSATEFKFPILKEPEEEVKDDASQAGSIQSEAKSKAEGGNT